MQPFAFYLLKVIACSGILLLYYRFALRNKRFHYYNRFYLLMAMASSLLLPLLNFNWFTVEGNSKAIILLGVINTQGGAVYTNARHGSSFALINWQLMFAITYIGVSFLLIVVLIWHIIKIYRLKKKYAVVNMAEFDFISTDLAQAPFSFLHNLFWREDIDMNEATGRQVLQHELTHIRQKHTWDKLWMQVITSVLWINPFFWFIQKELYMLHEFIADEKAIENNDGAAFAAMLLTSQYGKNIFSPAQQFSYSPIKRRLFMLTNLTKPRYSYARRLIVLPLLAAVVLLFAFKLQKKEKIVPQTHSASPFKIVIDAGHGGSDNGAVVGGINEKDITLSIAQKIKELSTAYGIDVILTRNGDNTLQPSERTSFASMQNANAFISIQANYIPPSLALANTGKGIIGGMKGMQVYVSTENKYYNQSTLIGSAIIESLFGPFRVDTVLKNGKFKSIWVLTHNNLPAIVLNCGLMNNATDLKQMTDETSVELMARKILEGIVAYANNKTNTGAPITKQLSNNLLSPIAWPTLLLLLDGKVIDSTHLQNIFHNTQSTFTVVILNANDATHKYGKAGEQGAMEFTTKKKDGKDIFVTDVSLEKVNPKTALLSEKANDKNITITDVKLEQAVPATRMSGSFTMLQPNGDTIYVRADSVVINPANHKDIEKIYQGSHGDSIQPATFPGGHEAWEEYLMKQLRADIPAKNSAPPGVYTVVVSFIVAEDGSISEAKAEKDPGYGTGTEAVRVIQRGPKWVPAKRNGQPAVYRQKQAVSFMVSK